MTYYYQISNQDELKKVRISKEQGQYKICIEDKIYFVSVKAAKEGLLHLMLDGQQHTAVLAKAGQAVYVAINGENYQLTKTDGRKSRSRQADEGGASTVEASMTGTVMAVPVSVGDAVQKGQTMILLEAMKMELRLNAPRDGVVAAIHCQAGDLVQQGHVLVALKAETE